jgi:NADPH-dependent glutamate synthase beta subunit-like oxidoreductase
MLELTEEEEAAPNQIDRRGFFRGAAALTVGGFGAAVEVATPDAQTKGAAPELADAAERLEKQTENALRWIGRDPADWVRPRAGVDHNVVIVGGGQSGLSIAYGLRRKGVGRVTVIDRAAPGETGIWRTIARMHQLRTPKTLAGPELGNAALSFRAWYETLRVRLRRARSHCAHRLGRLPRLVSAGHRRWFATARGCSRSNRKAISCACISSPTACAASRRRAGRARERLRRRRRPERAENRARVATRRLDAHDGQHPFDALAGKIVSVVGAGSSAFDAAAVALERRGRGYMFSRRSYIDYRHRRRRNSSAARPRLSNVSELAYGCRHGAMAKFLLGDRRVASVPLDSLNAPSGSTTFHHLNSSLSDVTRPAR